MKKNNKRKRNIPLYDFGGFLKDAGQAVGNYGKAVGDSALGVLGMGNVIPDSAYKGEGANLMKGIAGVAGQVGKIALPIAANMIVPGSGALVSAGQNALSQINPSDPNKGFKGNNQQYRQGGIQDPYFYMNNVKYPNGGMNMEPNAELEKQENVRYPNGITDQFDGNSHENGGIQTNLPPMTQVFSDKLKSTKGKTFAKEAKKYSTEDLEKTLSDNKADKLKKLSAQLMFERNNRKLSELFNEQESLKHSKVVSYAAKHGITIPPPNSQNNIPKMPDGGETVKTNIVNESIQHYPIYTQRNVGGKNIYYKSYLDTTPTGMRTSTMNSPIPGKPQIITEEEAVKAYNETPNQWTYGHSGDIQTTKDQRFIPSQQPVPQGTYRYGGVNQEEINETEYDNEYNEGEYKYGGIHIKPSHVGRFTAYKERTGQTTSEALHSSNPHVRQMANFARNASKWKHENGGYQLPKYPNGGKSGYLQPGMDLTDFYDTSNEVNPTGDLSGDSSYSYNPGGQGQGFDWKTNAQTALGLAPSIYNLGRAAFDKPVQYDASKYQTQGTQYRDVNFEPIQQGIRQERRIALSNAKTGSSGSAGTYLSNAAQIGANTSRATSQAQMTAQQYNNQNRFNVDQFNNQNEARNKAIDFQVAQMNDANRQKRSEMIGKGLEGVSQYTQGSFRDKQLLSELKKTYPGLSDYELLRFANQQK